MKSFLLIGALLSAACQPTAAQGLSEQTLTIIPKRYPDSVFSDAVISLGGSQRFYVLLTNNSSKPIRLFEEWNSWGYFGLSFEITYPDGRMVKSSKVRCCWDKNFPSTTTIGPQGFQVFDVDFKNDSSQSNSSFWRNSVLNEKPRYSQGTSCRMRAVYHIEGSKDSQENQAWTGTIKSPEQAYTIFH